MEGECIADLKSFIEQELNEDEEQRLGDEIGQLVGKRADSM